MVAQNVADAAARGNTKLSPEERFEKANLRAEYKSLYPMLSADAHNNTSLLNSRHAKPRGGGFVIELYSGGGRLRQLGADDSFRTDLVYVRGSTRATRVR